MSYGKFKECKYGSGSGYADPGGYDSRPFSFYNPAAVYLAQMDAFLARLTPSSSESQDPVDLVFSQQAGRHDLQLHHLADLTSQRRRLAEIHRFNLRFRLDDLIAARSTVKMLDPMDRGRRLGTIEKQILDLDRQQRDLEIGLWKDTLELQEKLLDARREYHAVGRRQAWLTGERDGGA